MRYVAPARGTVDPHVFDRMPLAAWREFAPLLEGRDWPTIDALNACLPADARQRFVAQTAELLADGMHYEQRIAELGAIATREWNWHDLFNALIWLRYPPLKRALNARQLSEIAHMGPKQRSRPQYALTHFDEAGVIVSVADPMLLALWDAHDWHGLFWREREAWQDGRLRVELFGHALLEHALTPGKLLVGKALVVMVPGDDVKDCSAFQRRLGSCDSELSKPKALNDSLCLSCERRNDGEMSDELRRPSLPPCTKVIDACAQAVLEGRLLRDPLELRPLPLAGVAGWHPDNAAESFSREAPCFQPLRAGRAYPAPMTLTD